MRVLIDECIDERFRNSLPEHDCQTARYAGLAGLKMASFLVLHCTFSGGFSLAHRPMGQRNKKCEACSYDLRGAKRRHARGPDSREGRFTLIAPGVGASTRNQWTG